MKSLPFFKLNIASIILISLLCFECCTVYEPLSSNTKEAVESTSKVKIITINNRKLLFDQLIYEQEILYGIIHNGSKVIKTIVPEDQIKEIYLKDDYFSKYNTVLLLACVIGIPLAITIILLTMDFNISGWQ